MGRTSFSAALRRALQLAWIEHSLGPSEAARRSDQLLQWKHDRREFMRTVGFGGAGLAGLSVVGSGCDGDQGAEDDVEGGSGKADDDGPNGVRVAVVGAGVGGLHCAYRLKQAGVRAQVFEARNRVGGRIFSARDKFADGQVAELGAELIDSTHPTMLAIAEELGLRVDDLHANEPEGHRREVLRFDNEVVDVGKLLQQFHRTDGAGMSLAAAMGAAVEAADNEDDETEFTRLDNLNITQWLDEVGADPLIRKVIEVGYTADFGLEAEDQSALNLLYSIDYENTEDFHLVADSDERFHLHGGNDGLTTALAEALGFPSGDSQIEVEMRLTAISSTADGAYRLYFDGPGGSVERVFDHVVLALPFTLLREVDLSSLDLDEDKRNVINEVGYGANAKIMGGFNRRVWFEDHNAAGVALSDNGLQFIWDTARGQDGEAGLLTNFRGGKGAIAMGEGTPEERMQELLPWVEQVFAGSQGEYVPDSAQRMHWPTSEFTKAGYMCYRPGQWETAGTEGLRQGNLHFCGEHTSEDFWGWMEGAAETGGLVAMEIIDDLGIEASIRHEEALGYKLLMPHSTYHGTRKRRSRKARRRFIRSEQAKAFRARKSALASPG